MRTWSMDSRSRERKTPSVAVVIFTSSELSGLSSFFNNLYAR